MLSLERIPEIPPQQRWKKAPCLCSIISYHITLQRSCLWTFPLKSTTVLAIFMALFAKRIISDRCREQMAVSHDGVERLQHVARGVSFICGRSWFLFTEDAQWLKTLQLWAKCQQEWGWKWNQQPLPGGLHSADEAGVLRWPGVRQWPKQVHTCVALMTIDSSVQYFVSRHLSVSSSLKSALGNSKPTSNWTNSERSDRICSLWRSALHLLIC